MSDTTNQCLDAFPGWLTGLPGDVRSALDAARSDELGDEAKRHLLGAVNYLFKSLDLIPDGIDDIGYLDDAFVLRYAARNVLRGDCSTASPAVCAPLERLSAEASLIDDLLGLELVARLESYTNGLRNGAARGRMVDEMLNNEALLRELDADVNAFMHDYAPPSFHKDEKNIIKLKAFLDAKLPQK